MQISGLSPLTIPPLSSAWSGTLPDLAQDMAGVLSGSSGFQQGCARIGDRFDLHPFSVAMFFANVGQLLPVLCPESSEDRVSTLGTCLQAMQGRSSFVGGVASFLVGDDWHRRPYRSHQTLFEALDIAAVGLSVYHALGASLPDQPVMNPMAVVGSSEQVARHSLSGTPGAVELWTGVNESHGGLQFHLVAGENQLVAKLGVQLSSDTVSVVQMQGGGKTFSARRDRLRPALGNLHPFDWLLRNVADWASAAGFRRMRGCGYRLNSSLVRHFKEGDFPEERRLHFGRLYDDRFLSLGMTADPQRPDVFELDLAKTAWPAHSEILRLMEGALKV